MFDRSVIGLICCDWPHLLRGFARLLLLVPVAATAVSIDSFTGTHTSLSPSGVCMPGMHAWASWHTLCFCVIYSFMLRCGGRPVLFQCSVREQMSVLTEP